MPSKDAGWVETEEELDADEATPQCVHGFEWGWCPDPTCDFACTGI